MIRRATGPGRARGPLEALNFFLADVQSGMGPFLGVFLQHQGWLTAAIGAVISLGGMAAMLITGPAGALIDATSHKRRWVILAGTMVVLASGLILLSQRFWLVAASRVATGVASAVIGPALVGMTLGIARQEGFNAQNGRNQAFNHAGSMVGAGLSGVLGWRFGLAAVFWLSAGFGLLSIASVLMIPKAAIDDRAARGLSERVQEGQAKGFRVLLESRPLLVLAAALGLYQLGSAAMLPMFGMALVAAHKGDPAGVVAKTVVVGQGVMVLACLAAMRVVERRGYWPVLLLTFIALPLRGLLAAFLITPWGVWPIQTLYGVATGLQSVATPGVVARVMSGTGRVNAANGAVLTLQGLGAVVSPALGGGLAHAFGFRVTFCVLSCVSLASLALWLVFAPVLKPACARGA